MIPFKTKTSPFFLCAAMALSLAMPIFASEPESLLDGDDPRASRGAQHDLQTGKSSESMDDSPLPQVCSGGRPAKTVRTPENTVENIFEEAAAQLNLQKSNPADSEGAPYQTIFNPEQKEKLLWACASIPELPPGHAVLLSTFLLDCINTAKANERPLTDDEKATITKVMHSLFCVGKEYMGSSARSTLYATANSVAGILILGTTPLPSLLALIPFGFGLYNGYYAFRNAKLSVGLFIMGGSLKLGQWISDMGIN